MKRFLLILSVLISSTGIYAQPNEDVTPLITAIKTNDLAEVKNLVQSGADVNERDGWMTSPIEHAIRLDHLPIVEFLLASGAKERRGLNDAARNNNLNMVKLLLKNDFKTYQSAVYAAEHNNMAILKVLVEAGAKTDFFQKRKTGLFKKHYVSPLGFAFSHDNKEMIYYLVANGVPVETAVKKAYTHKKPELVKELSVLVEDKESFMIDAFSEDQDDIVQYMIQNGANPNAENKQGNTMLLIAARQGDLPKVKKCIEKYNPYLQKKNKEGANAIMMAVQSGDITTVEYLMEKGVKLDALNNDGESALFYALSPDRLDMIDFLIRKGLDPKHTDKKGKNILMKASSQRRIPSVVNKVLRYGIDVNQKDNKGHTALYYALGQSSLFVDQDLIKILIEQGADVNTPGPNGKTLMFRAIEREKMEEIKFYQSKGASVDVKDSKGRRPSCDNPEIIKFLVENGADINAVDNRHDSFLCEAVYANDLELAHYLIDKGIDPNQQCYFKEQPIIKAVEDQNLDLVRFLAENGADVNAVGYFEKNVMDYAQKEGNQEIIRYLKGKGAMTKEERNEMYRQAMKLESEIKTALIAEDLTTVNRLMAQNKVVVIQRKLVHNIAYVAAKQGNSNLINRLLSDDVNFDLNEEINVQKQTILYIAVMYNQDKMVLDLLSRGANIDHIDAYGRKAEDYVAKGSVKKVFKQWRKSH